MTTALSIRDFAPHEIARLRLVIDKMRDWEQQQKFHSLIDAYEAQGDVEEANEALEKERDEAIEAKSEAQEAQSSEEAKNLELQAEIDWLYEQAPTLFGSYPDAKVAAQISKKKKR